MLTDEVFAYEQGGVLATEDVVWGCCGSYLGDVIQLV